MLFRAALRSAILLCALGFVSAAEAQVPERWDLCARQYWAEREQAPAALGIASSETELLIREIAASFGLSASSVTTISCHRVQRALAVYTDGSLSGVPAGEYVVFNEQWVREVIGSDRVQAVALFGHELGHLLNRDFLPPRNLAPRAQLETEADEFAGCAVAATGGDWASVQDLFSRLRAEEDSFYPNRLQSLEAARRGYDRCATQPAAHASGLRLDVQGLEQLLPDLGAPVTLDGAHVFCEGARFTLVFANGGQGSSLRINSISVEREPLDQQPASTCNVDTLASQPFGIVLVDTYVVSVRDDGLTARYIRDGENATAVDPHNLLRVGAQSRAITLAPDEAPFGIDIILEARGAAPQAVRINVVYDDGGERTLISEPVLIWR